MTLEGLRERIADALGPDHPACTIRAMRDVQRGTDDLLIGPAEVLLTLNCTVEDMDEASACALIAAIRDLPPSHWEPLPTTIRLYNPQITEGKAIGVGTSERWADATPSPRWAELNALGRVFEGSSWRILRDPARGTLILLHPSGLWTETIEEFDGEFWGAVREALDKAIEDYAVGLSEVTVSRHTADDGSVTWSASVDPWGHR